MPKVIAYSIVLDQLQKKGLKSLYYNSGAFWFGDGVESISRGWIGPADPSISVSARPLVRQASEPYPAHLSQLFIKFWQTNAPGPLWIMPKSHWAYELQFGSQLWLGDVLQAIGIDATPLARLNHAPAIEFDLDEAHLAERFIGQLLTHLFTSDFQAVFADARTICTIHSRAQLWWTTVDSAISAQLDALLPKDAKANPSNFSST